MEGRGKQRQTHRHVPKAFSRRSTVFEFIRKTTRSAGSDTNAAGVRAMLTLQESRNKLDEQIELLRRLQRDKTMAAVEQQEAIQKQIDESQKQIRELDSTVQQLMKAPKSTSRTIY